MKSASLKENSIHGFLYRQIYNRLPSEEPNLCNYFWKIMLIFISLPFLWINLIYPCSWRSYGYWQAMGTGFFTYVGTGYLMMIGMGFADKREWEVTPWEGLLLGLGVVGVVIVALGVIGAIIFGAITGGQIVHSKLKPNPKKEDGLVVSRWKAFKGKYCPKIDWK